MAVAEPVGVIAGFLVGRVCARYGRRVCARCDIPDWIGGALGSLAGHYVASAMTKAVCNVIAADAIGGVANVAVTSPMTALAHAAYEAFSSVFPSLDSDGSLMPFLESQLHDPTIQDSIQQMHTATDVAGQDAAHAVMDGQPHLPAAEYLPFDDPAALCAIADHQVLNTCGLKTCENMAQIAGAPVGNDLADHVVQAGLCDPHAGFPMDSYQALLQGVGCVSYWFDASDMADIVRVVGTPGGSVGLIGDPYYLGDPIYQAPGGLHAITLVEPWIDPADGRLHGVVGIDSNHAGHVMGYSFEQLAAFVQRSPLRIQRYVGKALMCLPGPDLLAIAA